MAITNARIQPPAINQNRVESVIGKTVTIEGNLFSIQGIRIDGNVSGNVVCNANIITGDESTIVGDLTGEVVEISGDVSGNIRANAVRFMSTANVKGDVECEQIQADSGAKIDGHIVMRDSSFHPVNELKELKSEEVTAPKTTTKGTK